MARTQGLVAALVMAFTAIARAHAAAAPDPEALYAQGACGAAVHAAAAAITAMDAGHRENPDVLARFGRIALNCRLPDSAGLDAALARELALRENSSGADSAAVAEVRLRMARRALQRNRIDEALALTQALQQQPRFARWPPALRGRVLGQLAAIDNQRADAQPALDHAVAAIALLRAGAGAEPMFLIEALQEQGFALTRMRQGAKAVPVLDEAVAIARERYGPNRREHAEALRFLAYARRDAGDFGGAIDAFEKALAIHEAQAEIDGHALAVLQLNLAQTLKISGDGERALVRYEQALASDAKAPDPAGRTRPAILHGLANLYRDRNDSARALALYAEAVPLFASVFGERSVQLAQVLNNYGNAQGNAGDYEAAIALYERALAIARERDSVDPGDYAPQVNIAMLRIWQARYAEAEPAFREILERLRSVAVGSEGNTLFARLGLSASLWGQGRLDEAFAVAARAEQLRQAGLRLAVSHLGEEHAIGLQEYQRPTLDFVIAIAAASGNAGHLQRAWELSMSARDQVTAQIAQRLAVARSAHDATLAPLWQAWRDASGAASRAELEAPAGSLQRRDAQDALDHAERALAAASPLAAAAIENDAHALADVRRAMPADSTLILFVPVQPHMASDFAKPEAEQRSPDLFAFVAPQRGGEVHALRLGTLDDAAARIDAWTVALGDRRSALADVAARGRAVREMLWDPLSAAVSGKRVLLIPTGALFRMPWAALPERGGFLLDAGWTFHVLNHEGELLDAPPSGSERLLAVADPSPLPSLHTDAACTAADLTALPGARREVERLRAIWHDRFGNDDQALTLVGADATEARVRRESGRAAVLHFATHSIGNGAGCALASTRSLTLVGDAPAGDAAAAPLPPSALALAANDPARSDDDGLFGAEEIATLDLSRVRWAVLAACATAAGSTRHYEGLFGLSRAFRLAGARTVIMSLWPVDDAATEQWTEALYAARLVRGLDTAASMQSAQHDILAGRRQRGESVHPYYWAAFVAAGDWR